MFTGIIEELGTIRRLDRSGQSAQLVINCKKVLEGCRPGDSIAVNGACLTVTRFDATSFTAEASSETLLRTTLGASKSGDTVNLERALRFGDRLGGHLVTGHVDGVGSITGMERQGDFVLFTFSAPDNVARYLVEKGSIAVDGISLTVASTRDGKFSVMLIPHTLGETTLGSRAKGAAVNLEADIIGKYVEKLVGGNSGCRNSSGLTEETLAKYGFLK